MLSTRLAGFALALCCLLEAVVFLAHGTPWLGEWNWTLDFAVGCSVLTGPVVASLAAWIASSERRRAAINDSTPNGWLVPGRAAIAATAVGLGAFLLGLVCSLVATLSVTHGGPLTAWLLLLVPCLLLFYAAVGAVIGHQLPFLIVVVVIAPATFLLGNLGILGIGPNVLRQGPTTGSLAGLTWDAEVVTAQAAVLVGAALTLLLAQGMIVRRVWREPVLGVAAVGSLLVGGLVSLSTHGDESFLVSDERATACADTRPRVCVAPSNRRALRPVSSALTSAARLLSGTGATIPAEYRQGLPRDRGWEGAGVFALPAAANVTTVDAFQAAHMITMPESCAAWYGDHPPAQAAYEAQELIATWIMRAAGEAAPAFTSEADAWLRSTSPQEQSQWIRTTYEHLRTCTLNAIVLPWDRSR